MAEWSSCPCLNEGHDNHEYLTFNEWWNEYPVTAIDGNWITRKEIVLWAVNKDGGAHVDEILPETYTRTMNSLIFNGPDKDAGSY